ncbi:MAG: ribosome silencing factor [Clostridia bacterium]|nr:ribosome silencing factor [Clostridia bacterium]
MESKDLVKKIVKILDKKKGAEIKVIKIDDLTVIADYFIIVTGTSSTQVKALAGEVEFMLKQEGIAARNIEGHNSNTWILMDYNSVIVHVFYTETRKFYDLEHLWQDGTEVDISEIIEENAAE